MENYSRFTDPKLSAVYEKVEAEERLSLEDGVSLMKARISQALVYCEPCA